MLHVSEVPIIKSEKTSEAQNLDRYFKSFKHSFHSKLDKHVDEGINEYIDENSTNLLTIAARKMANHSKVPLLILPQD